VPVRREGKAKRAHHFHLCFELGGARRKVRLYPPYKSTSIPRGREAGIHAAHVLPQACDGLHVLIVEADIERIEIGLLAFPARRLRNRGDAVLIEQPFQRHLGRAGAMLAADRNQRFVGSGAALWR